MPKPPKVGVTAAESGTYTDVAQINLGGLTPDGADAVNDVTFLLLDVIEEMRLLQPSSSNQVSKKSPDRFVRRAARIIRTGYGQPSVFNSDLIVEELVRQGKSVVDARAGGSSGCVEVGAFGKEAYILTGYFNMPKCLELALHNGLDPMTGKQLGPRTGIPEGAEALTLSPQRGEGRGEGCGRPIGWFQGRMEFGPRALGSRSILADARNPEKPRTW